MSLLVYLEILSFVVAIVSLFGIIPVAFSFVTDEVHLIPYFVVPILIFLAVAFAFKLIAKNKPVRFTNRAVFAVVACCWLAISLFGSIPLYFSGTIPSYCDAFFESVSGFTTTGATILSSVESIPKIMNLWRCEMHWLGGMGIIALTVAILPLLGVGGFQLIKAESSGPEKGKLTPKMANTAKTLWLLYLGFTVVETIALKLCGLTLLDSIAHAFSTLGTGGFSTLDASVGGYNKIAVEIICTVFMFLAGINFSLYFYVLSGRFNEIKKNDEFKAYIGVFLAALIGVVVCLIPYYGGVARALRYGSFQVASIITTSGFMTADYTQWPYSAQFFIFLLFFTGSCSGSTSGGIKLVRWVVFCKQARNEILRMLHPRGVFSIRMNGIAGRKDLVFNVAAFLYVYLIIVAITTFVGTTGGLDIFSAFTGALSMTGSIGPAFGQLSPVNNPGFLPVWVKLWYCFAMLAGRLELYNMIIFFIKDYWKN